MWPSVCLHQTRGYPESISLTRRIHKDRCPLWSTVERDWWWNVSQNSSCKPAALWSNVHTMCISCAYHVHCWIKTAGPSLLLLWKQCGIIFYLRFYEPHRSMARGTPLRSPLISILPQGRPQTGTSISSYYTYTCMHTPHHTTHTHTHTHTHTQTPHPSTPTHTHTPTTLLCTSVQYS